MLKCPSVSGGSSWYHNELVMKWKSICNVSAAAGTGGKLNILFVGWCWRLVFNKPRFPQKIRNKDTLKKLNPKRDSFPELLDVQNLLLEGQSVHLLSRRQQLAPPANLSSKCILRPFDFGFISARGAADRKPFIWTTPLASNGRVSVVCFA